MKKLLNAGLFALFCLYVSAALAQDMTFTFSATESSYNQLINNADGEIIFLCKDQKKPIGPPVYIGKTRTSFKEENNIYVAKVTIDEQDYKKQCGQTSDNTVNLRAIFLKTIDTYGESIKFEYSILGATPAILELDPAFVQKMFLNPINSLRNMEPPR